MKHFILLMLATLLFSTAYAQNGKVEYQQKCGLTGFPYDEADELAHYGGDIYKYFNKNVNWKKMELIGGLIMIDVAVDTMGNPCTVGFTNKTVNTDHAVLYLYLDNIINKMPRWQPAKKDGKPVNNTTRIAIYSAVDGHKDFEVTYFRSFAQQTEKIRVIPRPIMQLNAGLEDFMETKKDASRYQKDDAGHLKDNATK
jgi:hypothetical protein